MTLLYQHQFVFINTKIGRSKDPTWFHPDVKTLGALTNVRRVTRSKNHFGFPCQGLHSDLYVCWT